MRGKINENVMEIQEIRFEKTETTNRLPQRKSRKDCRMSLLNIKIFLIASVICLLFGILKADDSKLIHLNFKDASEKKECFDESGLLKCFSKNGSFRIERGSLRCFIDSDYVIDDNGTMPSFAEELTASAWIILRNTNENQTILLKGNRNTVPDNVQFCISIVNGYPEFKFKDASGTWKGLIITRAQPTRYNCDVNIPQLKPELWYHIAATFKNGTVKIFLNGKQRAESDTGCKSLTSCREPLIIGSCITGDSKNPALRFNGLLNDLRLYNKALDDKSIKDIYDSEKKDYPGKGVKLETILTEGYDPEFKTKLKITEVYEKNIPSPYDFKNTGSFITSLNGANGLFINGKAVYPMQMMPSPYTKNSEIFDSCRDFAAAGVDLYSDIIYPVAPMNNECSDWWLGDGIYDFSKVDARLGEIVKANPNALIMIRIKLDSPQWWIEKYPDDVAAFMKDGKIAIPDKKKKRYASLASELWENSYRQMLRDFVKHVESGSYAKNVYGYTPGAGRGGEWCWYAQEYGFIDYCPAAQKRFKKFIKEKYDNDPAKLRATWNNPSIDFENIEIPSPSFRQESENGCFRDPVKAKPVTDYREFLNNIISGIIIDSCRICKEETSFKKTTCVFYGYSMRCEGISSWRMQNNGLNALGKVIQSPYVDMICSPSSYNSRRGGEEGNFISAYNGSYRLNNKLFWDEADIRTHFYDQDMHGRTKDMSETISVLQRHFGKTLTYGTGMWWFLLVGNATFHHDDTMEAIRSMKKIGDENLSADKTPTAQTAFIVDEESMNYTQYGDNAYIMSLLWTTYCEAARMGAPYDIYLLDDVLKDSFPEYKTYIFMNCFGDKDGKLKKAAEKLRKNNAVQVWCYAPGYVTNNGFSLENIKEITGINIKQEFIQDAVVPVIAENKNQITGQCEKISLKAIRTNPFFNVDDPETQALAVSGKKVLMAVKKFENYSSVYTMVPLTKELLQGLCDYAGAHVYSRSYDVFSANKSFIMLHNSTNGKKTISLPEKSDVTELLSGREIGKEIAEFTEDFDRQTTRIYKVSVTDKGSFLSRLFGIK